MHDNWRSSAGLPAVRSRARILKVVRAFFDARDVLEIETPVVASTAVTDPHIDSMKVDCLGRSYYLNTSPEYAMKRFVAEYGCSVYQVTKCFREGELGPQHNPEFTMLEWYRVGWGMDLLIEEIIQLLDTLAMDFDKRFGVDRKTCRELFMEHTGINPHDCDVEQLCGWAQSAGLDVPVGMATGTSQGVQGELDRDAWLDWLMSEYIADRFERHRITVVTDYPRSQSALAKLVQNGFGETVARRFECYLGPVELANGYDELTDVAEQRVRFEHDNHKRELLAKPICQPDERLLAALESGLPACSGVAVGLDRLLQVLCGQSSLSDVICYPWGRV